METCFLVVGEEPVTTTSLNSIYTPSTIGVPKSSSAKPGRGDGDYSVTLFHSLFSIDGTDADCEDSEEEPVKKKSDGPGMKAGRGFLCCYNAVVTGGVSQGERHSHSALE